MARPRGPNRDKAFKIYKRYNGKIKNKEIAEILGEDPKTISKWKHLDNWDEKLQKNSNNPKKEISYGYTYSKNEGEIEKDINSVDEANELNEKQVLFCIYYIKMFNATKAYQQAYKCDKTVAAVNGCKLLKNPNIQKTIQKLKQGRINRAMLSPDDIFQKYMDIAFSDITEYIQFGQKQEVVATKKVGKDVVAVYGNVNYLDFKNWDEIDGTIIKEVKLGKGGVGIKLEDRLKALDWLADHLDLATEEQRARVESLKSKVWADKEHVKLAKKKFEREDF